LNWEEKRRNHLLQQLLEGKKVDLRKDEELYYAAFGKQVSMDEFVNRAKYKNAGKQVKLDRELNRPNSGWTEKKHMKHVGEIPASLFLARPEFHPSNPDRDKEIKKFLALYPQFKVSEY